MTTKRVVDLIAGARPNFMKVAPIIDALEAAKRDGSRLDYRLIHTGQHYDRVMSEDFFEQLEIPRPHINLEVGSGTAAEQTGAIMVRYEQVLMKESRPAACLVVGDVTSTMACAIAARKNGVPVGHVEGGIRSGDWSMPEEINRVVTDSIANWFFTTSESAGQNLRRAGIADVNIHFVGNTMIDTLLKQLPRLRRPKFWDEFGLREREYLVVTLHRPANVDGEHALARTLAALVGSARGTKIVFPVHPRTAKSLAKLDTAIQNIHFVEPQGYLEFNYLVRSAKGVVTDSGGITEETTVMGVPCVTLRDTTERPETVTVGTNELVGTNPEAIGPALKRLMDGRWKSGGIPEKWDGKASARIVGVLERLVGNGGGRQ